MIKLKKFFKLLRKKVRDTDLLNYAAQLSYGLMLAFLPLLMLLSLVFNIIFENKEILEKALSFISDYLPAQFAELIITSITSNKNSLLMASNSSIAVNIALLVFIVYSVVRLFRLLMVIFTDISHMKETRNFIYLWVKAVIDLISVLILIGLSTYLYIETRVFIIDLLRKYLTPLLRSFLETIYGRFIYVYIIVILFCTVDWILATFPAKKIKYREAVPGAIFVILGWSFIMALINFLNNYLVFNGFINILDQGLIIMLTIYLVSLVLLTGLLINNAICQLRIKDKHYIKSFVKKEKHVRKIKKRISLHRNKRSDKKGES